MISSKHNIMWLAFAIMFFFVFLCGLRWFGRSSFDHKSTSSNNLLFPPTSVDSVPLPSLKTRTGSAEADGTQTLDTSTDLVGITPPFQFLRGQASDLIRSGKAAEGEAILESILESTRDGFDRAEAGRMLGQRRYFAGRHSEAIEYLDRAILDYQTGDSTQTTAAYGIVTVTNLLADIYMMENQPERALQLFREALAIRSTQVSVSARIASHGGVIEALRRMGDVPREIAAIRQLLDEVPGYGRDSNGNRVNRLLRLAELEHPVASGPRLSVIDALAAEPWLATHPRRFEVAWAGVRELKAQQRYEQAWNRAVAIALPEEESQVGGIENIEHEQLLISICDRADGESIWVAKRAWRILAMHSRDDMTKDLAVRKLEQFADQ